jgi:N-acetyl-anhydromuramyl-L-alanine amidase AmpD
MSHPHVNIAKRERLAPNVVVRHYSPCQSERDSVPLDLIVLHDTEGANIPNSISDLAGLGDFFGEIGTQASSHVATDGDGNSARFVSDRRKAWHCMAYNSASLGIEQIGFVSQTRATWMRNWRQLRETARWIAYWSHKYGIPIRRASVSNGAVTRAGVTRHMDLGIIGGGHVDPGANYPFNRVLWLARAYRAARFLRR